MSRAKGFLARLRAATEGGKTVCVGLDSEIARLPEHFARNPESQLRFNTEIVEATADLVAAYKPNAAFYEAAGVPGVSALVDTVAMIRSRAPDVVVILDAKRGDIGNTNIGYATFAFDVVGADAITLHPYLGSESATEFLRDPDRGAFVLCRTSNVGAREMQDLVVEADGERVPMYRAVARLVRDRWNTLGNCGIVAGGTYPSELADIRSDAPDLPVLVPGVGAQGADLHAALDAVSDGRGPVLINNSRSVLFASSGRDFAAAARRAVVTMDVEIREHHRRFEA